MRKIFGPIFSIGLTIPALCYSQDECLEVLRYTGRNDVSQAQTYAIANRIYSQQCQGSTYKENKSLNIGLDAVVKAIPLKFNLGKGSDLERMESFCQSYYSFIQQNFSEAISASTVSVDSIKAWESCQRFKNSGIEFSPNVLSSFVTISVKKTDPNPVVVEKIEYDPNILDCQTTSDDSNPKTSLPAKAFTRKTLNSGDQWHVSCGRLGQKQGAETFYPSTYLSVLTTAGPFTLPIPSEAEIGSTSAREISENIKVLAARLDDTAKRGLSCKVFHTDESTWGQSPSITARSPEFLNDGYTLAGGGCELGGEGRREHNGPITQSMPTAEADGWFCRAMDPPNIHLSYSVRAYAIYCRLD